MKRRLVLACLIAALAAFPRVAAAQDASLTSPAYADAREAADILRDLFFQRDQVAAYAIGQQMLEQYPDDTRLGAWVVLNGVRADAGDEALAMAERMVAEQPDDPWARFGLAGVLTWVGDRGEDALEASLDALAAASPHPDFVWLHSEALLNHAGEEEAIAYIDDHVPLVENPAEILALKGYALNILASRRKDAALFVESEIAFAQAHEADSASFTSWWLEGIQLLGQRRVDEALVALKRAAKLSRAPSIHSRYWYSVQGVTTLTVEEKRAVIEADIDQVLAERPDDPNVLQQVASTYGSIDLPDKKAAVERRLLEEFGGTLAAERVLVGRYRAFAEDHGEAILEDPALKAQYAGMLRAFIDRPEHQRETLLGDAYLEYFNLIHKDAAVSTDELLEIVEGMVAYEGINPHITHAGGAIALADRKAYFRRAEELAKDGVDVATAKLEEQREWYDTEGDYENAVNYLTSIMYDALGWVYFREGRLEEAEAELLHAYDLYQESTDNLHHLGQLHEARYAALGAEEEAESLPSMRLYPGDHELGKAEGYYIKGVAVERPGENPNEAALQELYGRRYGSLDGFEAYRADIEEIDRAYRLETVLAERAEMPEPAPSFDLATLEGDSLSSSILDGKTTVVNFWGIWCGWCIEEMPDLQELHERYRSDPDVQILTINNDLNPDEVVVWMEEKGYTFPVLLDHGYAAMNGVKAYPTTWFVDPQGRIAFSKRGWSEKLIEEFTWRIDALRESE